MLIGVNFISVSNPYRNILSTEARNKQLIPCVVSNPYRNILSSGRNNTQLHHPIVSNPYRNILSAFGYFMRNNGIRFPILTGIS